MKIPFVLLKIAMTSNGFISWGNGIRKRVSGREGIKRLHELRNEYDAVLVGINTILKDNPRLTCRIKGKRNPIRVAIDPKLLIPLKSNFLENNAKRIIFCSKDVSDKKRELLEKINVEVIKIKGDKKYLDLKQALCELGKRNIVSVLVEGGQKLNSSFLNEKLADKVIFIIAKKNIKKGLYFVDKRIKRIHLKHCDVKKLGKDILVAGYVN